ncbi:MAG TPA: SMP-30/gluconolactonase/LRE family protein [Trebonia sp.]|jgi:sugar lactone lactonase YvrE|nr:SMP-30/gluconolactonase/LRE family protein [Trebonia sp.]
MVDVRAGGAEPVSDVRAMLGEGPYWVPEDDKLLWVDAEDGLLHSTDVVTGGTESTGLDAVTAVFPVLGGGLLTAGGNKLTRRFPGEGRPDEVVAEAPALPGVRFNDGAVDPAGRVWVGSMHIGETEPLGTLYRLGPGGQLTPVAPGATVSNGIGWSPDGTRMYYSDSPLRRIDVFDYDPATGDAFQRRVFVDLRGCEGVPDGLTVDADGCVWVAMWGGAAVRRFTPAGQPDRVLEVPAAQPSSCAFGGPGLTELYVTTARVRLSEAELAAQPLAGRLLRFRPGPVGLPSTTSRAAIPS